jgi:hypothetical protein
MWNTMITNKTTTRREKKFVSCAYAAICFHLSERISRVRGSMHDI